MWFCKDGCSRISSLHALLPCRCPIKGWCPRPPTFNLEPVECGKATLWDFQGWTIAHYVASAFALGTGTWSPGPPGDKPALSCHAVRIPNHGDKLRVGTPVGDLALGGPPALAPPMWENKLRMSQPPTVRPPAFESPQLRPQRR